MGFPIQESNLNLTTMIRSNTQLKQWQSPPAVSKFGTNKMESWVDTGKKKLKK